MQKPGKVEENGNLGNIDNSSNKEVTMVSLAMASHATARHYEFKTKNKNFVSRMPSKDIMKVTY